MELISDILNVFFSDTEREVDDAGEQVHVGEPRVRDPLHQRHHHREDARVRRGQGHRTDTCAAWAGIL